MNNLKMHILKKLIRELKEITKSKVVLTESKNSIMEGKRDISNSVLLRQYVESLLRKFNVKELVSAKEVKNFVIIKNQNENFDFDSFKPVINYLIKHKGFVVSRNKVINRKSFFCITDPKTKLSVLIKDPDKI